MPPYICVTHALSRREETDALCRGLSRYGFRFVCIHEQSEPWHREETLRDAALLIALTCPAAEAARTVASDIRCALERGMKVLCVSLEESELETRFCASAECGAVLIPTPAADTPDRHAVALFIHRLFVRHLARFKACFVPARCVEDLYGRIISSAVAAHGGDAKACYDLGLAYERGEGVPKLEVEAAHWFSRAAERGVLHARLRMGELYLTGRGTERDPEKAFRLFTEVAQAGDPRGEHQRGLCYLRGVGVMKDPTRAFESFRMAAEEGSVPSLYELGLLYRDGIGVRRDHRAAVRALYLVCALGAGTGDSRLPLSLLGRYVKGRAVCVSMRQLRRSRLASLLPSSAGKSGTCRRQNSYGRVPSAFGRSRVNCFALPEDRWISASIGGEGRTLWPAMPEELAQTVARAAVALGRFLEDGDVGSGILPHPTRALVWYRYALSLGSTEALHYLGDAYRRGLGAIASPQRAFRLYETAAARGHDPSRFAVGVCYERGIGIKADPSVAFLYYEKAAEAGYAPAQNNLGGCYERGIGIGRDLHAATEWYARAASEEPSAACRLGLCYERGTGVRKSMTEAYRLYRLAAEQGHAYAKYRLGLLYDGGVYEDDGEDGVRDSGVRGSDPRSSAAQGEGMLVSADYAMAVRLFEEAAEAGVGEAAYALALCCEKGHGVQRDDTRRILYLRKAAESGSIPACYSLGLLYLEGSLLVRDTVRAVSYLAEAASLWKGQDNSRRADGYRGGILRKAGRTLTEAGGSALYMLGYCCLYGIGSRGDPRLAARADSPEERLALAVEYFREASRAGHTGALTALGDLYACGQLRPDEGSAEEKAQEYYAEAVRKGTGRLYGAEDPADRPIDAYMSLADRAMREAETALKTGNEGAAEEAKLRAWRALQGCSELGSRDALVSMAACAYYGYGTPRNSGAALWFLDRAAYSDGGRVTAFLWMGDVYRMGLRGESSFERADQCYLTAIGMEERESESGAYTVRSRREARRKQDHDARAEACYRLATLRAVYFARGQDVRESFPYLVRAVLMGHTAAEDDLARMYAYETAYGEATAPAKSSSAARRLSPAEVYARHRLSKRDALSATPRDGRAVRSHDGWMTDYYTALWPVPSLFRMRVDFTSTTADRPAYTVAEVTPTMRAGALNYLGDCLFFGQGLPADPASAAVCYRRVTEMRIEVPRGQTPPPCLTWAQYSYGWCLLHGIGVPSDPRGAVRLLTLAARYHAEACYTLGECYENGVGVDAPDGVEAFKYYRRSLRLGYRKAESRVRSLEKRLRARS